MIRDAVVFRSIPLVTSGLAFLPACNDGGTNATGDEETTGSPTSVTESATDESSSGGQETNETSSSDDASTDTDPTADESSSDSGDPVCGAGSCGEVPPIGWFGPVTYARSAPGEPIPSCPADVLEPGPTVLDGFTDPGPAVCECSCELSQPQSCNSCLETSATQNCGGGGYYGGYCYYGSTPVTEACTNIDILGFVAFLSSEDYYYGGGGAVCEETESTTIPPFEWAATITTCRIPDTALTCDTGVCIPPAPEGFEAKWCMYQQGDIECPAGPYPVKTIFWSDVDDTRSCTNCSCGTAAESCTEAELLVFEDIDCAGVPSVVVPATNECVAATGQSIAGDFGAQGACPVSDASEPQGSIAPTGPFTFCCSE